MIDTLDAVRRLEAVGVDRRQAEAMAGLYKETATSAGSAFVTHEALRYELRLLEQRLVLKLGVLTVGCSTVLGLVVAILAFVLR